MKNFWKQEIMVLGIGFLLMGIGLIIEGGTVVQDGIKSLSFASGISFIIAGIINLSVNVNTQD